MADTADEPSGLMAALEASNTRLRLSRVSLSMSTIDAYVMYGCDDTTPCYVMWDIAKVPLVICCGCGGVLDLKKNLREDATSIAGHLHRHLKKYHGEYGQMCPFPVQIRNALLESSPQLARSTSPEHGYTLETDPSKKFIANLILLEQDLLTLGDVVNLRGLLDSVHYNFICPACMYASTRKPPQKDHYCGVPYVARKVLHKDRYASIVIGEANDIARLRELSESSNVSVLPSATTTATTTTTSIASVLSPATTTTQEASVHAQISSGPSIAISTPLTGQLATSSTSSSPEDLNATAVKTSLGHYAMETGNTFFQKLLADPLAGADKIGKSESRERPEGYNTMIGQVRAKFGLDTYAQKKIDDTVKRYNLDPNNPTDDFIHELGVTLAERMMYLIECDPEQMKHSESLIVQAHLGAAAQHSSFDTIFSSDKYWAKMYADFECAKVTKASWYNAIAMLLKVWIDPEFGKESVRGAFKLLDAAKKQGKPDTELLLQRFFKAAMAELCHLVWQTDEAVHKPLIIAMLFKLRKSNSTPSSNLENPNSTPSSIPDTHDGGDSDTEGETWEASQLTDEELTMFRGIDGARKLIMALNKILILGLATAYWLTKRVLKNLLVSKAKVVEDIKTFARETGQDEDRVVVEGTDELRQINGEIAYYCKKLGMDPTSPFSAIDPLAAYVGHLKKNGSALSCTAKYASLLKEIEGCSTSRKNTVGIGEADSFGPTFKVGLDHTKVVGLRDFQALVVHLKRHFITTLTHCLHLSECTDNELQELMSAIEHPNPKDDFIIQASSQERSGAHLNPSSWVVTTLENLSQKAVSADRFDFNQRLNKVRSAVFALIYACGSSSMRTYEVLHAELDLGTSFEGKIFYVNLHHPFNEPGLLYAMMIEKTLIEGCCVFDPFVSKAILIVQTILSKVHFNQLKADFLSYYENKVEDVGEVEETEEDPSLVKTREVRGLFALLDYSMNLWENDKPKQSHFLSSFFDKSMNVLLAGLRFKGSFNVKKLDERLREVGRFDKTKGVVFHSTAFSLAGQDQEGNELEIDLNPYRLLSSYDESDIRECLHLLVDVKGFNLSPLGSQLRRNLFVNFRLSLHDYVLRKKELACDTSTKDLCNTLLTRLNSFEERENALRTAAVSGQHVAKTANSNYITGGFFDKGRRDIKLPQPVQDICMLCLHMSAVVTDYQFRKSNAEEESYSSIAWNGVSSLELLRRRSDGWVGKNDTEIEGLVRSQASILASTFLRGSGNLFREQWEIVHSLIATRNDAEIALSCGIGKTLPVLVALGFEPKGSVHFLCYHLRALLNLSYEKLKEFSKVFDVRIFDQRDSWVDASTLLGELNASGCRPVLILAMTDDAKKDSFQKLIYSLHSVGRLRSFVIDEAHAPIQTLNYRDCMMQFALMVRSCSTSRRILLSGTYIPSLTPFIREFFGLSEFNVLTFDTKPSDYRCTRNVDFINISNEGLVPVIIQHLVRDELKSGCNSFLIFVQNVKDVTVIRRIVQQFVQSQQEYRRFTFEYFECHSELNPELMKKTLLSLAEAPGLDHVRIIVSTSILAEGADLPDIRSVFIVGPPYGGIMAVAQMVARVGRGSRSGEKLPRAYLIHFPTPNNGTDGDLIKFPSLMRNSIKAVGTQASVDVLFSSQNRDKCSQQILNKIVHNIEIPRCGDCSGCNQSRRARFEKLVSLNSASVVESAKKIKVEPPSSRTSIAEIVKSQPNLPQQPKGIDIATLLAEELIIWNKVREIFPKLLRICILCGKKEVHYPNQCIVIEKTMKNNGSSKWCTFCTGSHEEKFADLESTFKTLIGEKSAEGKARARGKLAELVRKCPRICRNNESWEACSPSLDPCVMCWFGKKFCATEMTKSVRCLCESDGAPVTQTEKYKVQSVLRGCFLLIWNDTLLRSEFFKSLPKDVLVNFCVPQSYFEFFQWGVYGKGIRLQNAYRVIEFLLRRRGLL